MTKNYLNISGKIESDRLAAFEIMTKVADSEDIPFFFFFSAARDIILGKVYSINSLRATLDIDIGVRVSSWIQYNKLKEGLVYTAEFEEDREFQRLIFHNRIKIDLIPFGPIADRSEKIRWPDDNEIILHIIGFEEAFKNSLKVRLRDEPLLEIKVVTLAGLAVLKIMSWNEGYPDRKKDAGDLAFIMRHYSEAGNIERIFNEHQDLIETGDSDVIDIGVRLLGRDIATILTSNVENRVLEVLDRETREQNKYRLAADMYTSDIFINTEFDRILGFLEELKRGILERI